ncbi:hypothetical protein F5X99DRAFT_372536 [Biscogniauxia marginata]|nr:hypothetical protein F5X99DRAFT_372536 [Biscogniauxia marginata]
MRFLSKISSWIGSSATRFSTFLDTAVGRSNVKQPPIEHWGRDMRTNSLLVEYLSNTWAVLYRKSELTPTLISISESVGFMCWPEFDSPSVFCRLLDKDKTTTILQPIQNGNNSNSETVTFQTHGLITGLNFLLFPLRWVRDSSFTTYILLRMGFPEETNAYMSFINDRFMKSIYEHEGLPIMFTIRGDTDIPEQMVIREVNQFGSLCSVGYGEGE